MNIYALTMFSYRLYITRHFLNNCSLKQVRFPILSLFLNGYGTSPQGLGCELVFQSIPEVAALIGHSFRHWGLQIIKLCKKYKNDNKIATEMQQFLITSISVDRKHLDLFEEHVGSYIKSYWFYFPLEMSKYIIIKFRCNFLFKTSLNAYLPNRP